MVKVKDRITKKEIWIYYEGKVLRICLITYIEKNTKLPKNNTRNVKPIDRRIIISIINAQTSTKRLHV